MTRHVLLAAALLVSMLIAGCQSAGPRADDGAQLAPPELGVAAPPLLVSEWVKGDPVDLATGRGKQVYVVEFWATWCGPCRFAIPHLTELQKKYADQGVRFIGVTRENANDEEIQKVKTFVADMGDQMDYTVAIDEGRGTFDAYMKAYHQNGIPHAFIIDRTGRIVWHAHPKDLDEPLAQVLDGTFDLAAAREKNRAQMEVAARMARRTELMRSYFQAVGVEGGAEQARSTGEEMLALEPADALFLNAVAWNILTAEGVVDRDLDLALRIAKAAYDACEGKNPAIVDTYARALFDNGQKLKAIVYQKKAVRLCEGEDVDDIQATLDRYLQEVGSD